MDVDKLPQLDALPIWVLQDASAQFGELVRKAREGAPQRVTVRGEEAVVILSAKDYVALTPVPPGDSLLELVRSWPQIECDEFDSIMREMLENPVSSPVSPPQDFGA